MKILIKPALVAVSLSLALSANAAPKTEANYLAECKSSINEQFDQVGKVKLVNVNSRRNVFKAKLRVKAAGETSVVLCEIRNQKPVALSCLKGNVCKANSVAAQ